MTTSLAYAVVKIEDKANWTLFLENLLNDIGSFQEHGWTFISGRQKVQNFC